MSGGKSGRSGTGNSAYRRNRAILLSQTDLCALCGHHGAMTADHIVTARAWPRGADGKPLPGLDELANLQPAHGTLGPGRENRCATCGRLCNQVRGARVTRRPTTRQWFPDRA